MLIEVFIVLAFDHQLEIYRGVWNDVYLCRYVQRSSCTLKGFWKALESVRQKIQRKWLHNTWKLSSWCIGGAVIRRRSQKCPQAEQALLTRVTFRHLKHFYITWHAPPKKVIQYLHHDWTCNHQKNQFFVHYLLILRMDDLNATSKLPVAFNVFPPSVLGQHCGADAATMALQMWRMHKRNLSIFLMHTVIEQRTSDEPFYMVAWKI